MMKKGIAFLLAICLVVGILPLSASAADLKASDVAKAYWQILDRSSFYTYGMKRPVYFSNICGDDVPEMIVVTSTDTKTEAQLWTYQSGSAKKLLTMNWVPVSVAKYYLYKLSDGRLALHYTNAGWNNEYSHESRYGYFYTLGSDGTYTQTSSFQYDYELYRNGSTRFVSGKLNGSSVPESTVKAEERKLLAGSLIFNSLDTVSGAKTVQEAKTYLNSIVGSFFDVPVGQYYTDAVEWAVNSGITSGTGTVTFSPNQTCTRAQAVTFLWRAAGSPKVSSSVSFSDVKSNAYYADAVKWAVAKGVTSGTGNGKFSPDAKCSRAQIVSFLYRAAGSPAVSGGASFSDVPASQYYYNAVRWAVANKITTGTGNGKFSPDSPCTRGQIAVFLHKASSYLHEETPSWIGTFVRENGETLTVKNVTDSNVYLTAKLLDAAGDWYEIDRVLTFVSGSNTVAAVPFRTGESLMVYYTLKSDRITVDYPDGWWPDQDFMRQ